MSPDLETLSDVRLQAEIGEARAALDAGELPPDALQEIQDYLDRLLAELKRRRDEAWRESPLGGPIVPASEDVAPAGPAPAWEVWDLYPDTPRARPSPRPDPPKDPRRYGRFGYLHLRPFPGLSYRPWPDDWPLEAKELGYLASLPHSSRIPALIPDLLERARALEQALYEQHGWNYGFAVLGSDPRATLTLMEPARPYRRIASVVYRKTREVHVSKQLPSSPTWGTLRQDDAAEAAEDDPVPTTVGAPSESTGAAPGHRGIPLEPGSSFTSGSGDRIIARLAGAPSGATVGREGVVTLRTEPTPWWERDLGLTPDEKSALAEALDDIARATTFFGFGPSDVNHWFEGEPYRVGQPFTVGGGFAVPVGRRTDPESGRWIEDALLRFIAQHPVASTRLYRTGVMAAHVAAVIAAFTVGVEAVVAIPVAGTVAIVVMKAGMPAAMVYFGVEGVKVLSDGDVWRTMMDEDLPLSTRNDAYGRLLEGSLAVAPFAAPRRLMGWTQRLGQPGQHPTLSSREAARSWPFESLLGRRPATASRPLSPVEELVGPLTPDELTRIAELESLWGLQPPKRVAGYIMAHRVPDDQLRQIVEHLRWGGWSYAERGALVRTGFAGEALDPTLMVRLLGRYGVHKVAFDARLGQMTVRDPGTGRFRPFTAAEADEYALFQRLRNRFLSAGREGTRFTRMTPEETARIQQELDELANSRTFVEHRMPRHTTPPPPNEPAYRFGELPVRPRGSEPTRGVLHGEGFELKGILGSTRARLRDLADPAFRNMLAQELGASHRTVSQAGHISATHAEAQAVGVMRRLGIREAWLDINNIHVCANCRTALERMLPPDSTLHVRYVDEFGRAQSVTLTGPITGR